MPVADPGGGPEARPLPLLNLVKKGWPPYRATSFVSHRPTDPPPDKFPDPLLYVNCIDADIQGKYNTIIG